MKKDIYFTFIEKITTTFSYMKCPFNKTSFFPKLVHVKSKKGYPLKEKSHTHEA